MYFNLLTNNKNGSKINVARRSMTLPSILNFHRHSHRINDLFFQNNENSSNLFLRYEGNHVQYELAKWIEESRRR